MNAPVRADLLELTPEALTALANAGFVKRAQKDVAAGVLPRLETEPDGTVRADFDDGVRTRLPPGRTLRDAACTCAASGMCRHRVMLVLAYQQRSGTAGAAAADAPTAGAPPAEPEGPWSPAHFDDAAVAASVSPSVLEQAARLAASRPVVAVQPWQGPAAPPMARLPMCTVRFFSRSSLVHARCDCQQGSGCAHVVVALWAFRAAGDLPAGTEEAMVEVTPRAAPAQAGAGTGGADAGDAEAAPAHLQAPEAQRLSSPEAQRLREALDALLLSLWLDGSAQPAMALAARFEALRAQAQALGWRWVDDALAELWLLLQSLQARSSRHDPLRLLSVVAELWARPRAAAHAEAMAAGPAGSPRPALHGRQILGVGVKGEVALDHLKLVSLGAALWSDETAEGASVLFADPDTQTVTVLERQWPRGEGAAGPAQALAGRRVAGFPLRQIAAGQVITKTATRRANGLIDLAAGARQTGVMPLSPAAWDDLAPPLRQASVTSLVERLRAALPDFVQPRQAASGAASGSPGLLHVVAFHGMEVQGCEWDAAAQVLHARIVCAAEGEDGAPEGAPSPALHLALPHRPAAPGAVDALARALAGEWGALRAVAGPVVLRNGTAVMQPLALLTRQRAVVPQIEPPAAQPLALRTAAEAPTPVQALLDETLQSLAQWLRQGLRHQPGGLDARAQSQARQLRQGGLDRSAALLEDLGGQLRSVDRGPLLAALSTLALLLQTQKG
ncbi:SWIM zinc finger family protein [Acidovorax sp. GBBC 3334]|uniref:SWIM zinc finger family protein n=1 Tax=Acidovorax sp. GBBC 3334 TaxID=2940496 RepID=UPI002304589C|nr:SWIM zinc finger family protein [Acidovorax sp. GBBC 3334]MDA8453725.1 SWIM zinc finger family protein [Acidovorax sp. GBBC 3334]